MALFDALFELGLIPVLDLQRCGYSFVFISKIVEGACEILSDLVTLIPIFIRSLIDNFFKVRKNRRTNARWRANGVLRMLLSISAMVVSDEKEYGRFNVRVRRARAPAHINQRGHRCFKF